MKTVNFVKQIDVKKDCADIDVLYGPYRSIAEALLQVPESRRAKGRTVGIIQDNKVVEYWWLAGTTDEDLVKKMVVDVFITDQQLEFCDETTYEDLVTHGLVDPDIIYMVYEDQVEPL